MVRDFYSSQDLILPSIIIPLRSRSFYFSYSFISCILLFTLPFCHSKGVGYSDEVDDNDHRNLRVLRNTTWTSIPYPAPPSCSRLLPHKVDPVPISVHIWKVDLEKEDFIGYIYWRESLDMTCSTDFWGTQSINIEKTSLSPYEAPLSKLNQTFLDMISLNEPIVLRLENQERSCSWMKTISYNHKRIMAVRSHIVFAYDGSIVQPQGNWRKASRKLYSDGYKTIQLTDEEDFSECPLKIFKTFPGFITPDESDPNIITIPDLSLLLTMSPDWTDIACVVDKVMVVFRTMGGYFISISSPTFEQ